MPFVPTIEHRGRANLGRKHGVALGPAQVRVESRPQVFQDGALLRSVCVLVLGFGCM